MTTRNFADTYVAKQASLGNIITINDAVRSDEFRNLYYQLRAISFEARHTTIGTPEREAAFAGDSDYAALLVALGRRRPEDTFDVGASPKGTSEAGGYINSVVLPSLEAQANTILNGG